MIITAQGAGGFAGHTSQFTVDTGKAANGHTIESLVRDMGFFSRQPPESVGADLMRWTISVQAGAEQRTVTFTDDGSAASAPWQTLLAHLRAAHP